MTKPDQAAERNQQTCTACGQADDHPRHVVIHDFLDDSKNKNQHLDCCVADGGCPNHCEPVLAAAGDARGLDLLPHIEAVHGESTDLNEGAPAFVESQNAKG